MMDLNTATKLGLPVEVATKEKHFGSFYGPGNKPIYYYGRIKGPLDVWLDNETKLVAPEVKVIEHIEPMMLLGTDVLKDGNTPWKFCYVGLHPETRTGEVVVAKDGRTKGIPLASWPKDG